MISVLSGTVGEATLTTEQMPTHKHNAYVGWDGGNGGAMSIQHSANFYWSNTHVSDTGSSGEHTHSMTGADTGNASSLPPYYVMSYIIRIM